VLCDDEFEGKATLEEGTGGVVTLKILEVNIDGSGANEDTDPVMNVGKVALVLLILVVLPILLS
jgi:hypothetical protein